MGAFYISTVKLPVHTRKFSVMHEGKDVFRIFDFVPAKNIGINFNYVCPAIESHSCKNCVEPRNIYFKLAPQSKSYRNAPSDSGSLFGVTQVRSNGASWNYEVTEASYNT